MIAAGPSARVDSARTPSDITSRQRRASRRSMISSMTRYTPTRRIASARKVRRSELSWTKSLNRSDVASATDRTTTAASTSNATRTVERRRLARANCTPPSYEEERGRPKGSGRPRSMCRPSVARVAVGGVDDQAERAGDVLPARELEVGGVLVRLVVAIVRDQQALGERRAQRDVGDHRAVGLVDVVGRPAADLECAEQSRRAEVVDQERRAALARG